MSEEINKVRTDFKRVTTGTIDYPAEDGMIVSDLIVCNQTSTITLNEESLKIDKLYYLRRLAEINNLLEEIDEQYLFGRYIMRGIMRRFVLVVFVLLVSGCSFTNPYNRGSFFQPKEIKAMKSVEAKEEAKVKTEVKVDRSQHGIIWKWFHPIYIEDWKLRNKVFFWIPGH